MLATVECINNNNNKLKLGGLYKTDINSTTNKCMILDNDTCKYISTYKKDKFKVVELNVSQTVFSLQNVISKYNVNKIFKVVGQDILVKNDGNKLMTRFLSENTLWIEAKMTERWFKYDYVLSSELMTFQEARQNDNLLKYKNWSSFYDVKGAINRLYKNLREDDIRHLINQKVWMSISSKF